MNGVVESVNVGVPRPVQVGDHTVWTAIWKSPVEGRVPLRGVNLRGDDQADRSVHGGPDKTGYAYSAGDTAGGGGGAGGAARASRVRREPHRARRAGLRRRDRRALGR